MKKYLMLLALTACGPFVVPLFKGDKGSAGKDGASGVQGEKGDRGEVGPRGMDGYSIVSRSEAASLVDCPAGGNTVVLAQDRDYDGVFTDADLQYSVSSFVACNGLIGAQGPQGLAGNPGQDGVNGQDGAQGPQGIPGTSSVLVGVGNMAVCSHSWMLFSDGRLILNESSASASSGNNLGTWYIPYDTAFNLAIGGNTTCSNMRYRLNTNLERILRYDNGCFLLESLNGDNNWANETALPLTDSRCNTL